MSTQQLAILAPRDGLIGEFDADSSCVYVRTPEHLAGTKLDARLFIGRFPDCTIVPRTSEGQLRGQLDREQSKAFALDFTLLLLKASSSDDVLLQCAIELDGLLRVEEVYGAVLDLVSARPLPDTADTRSWERHTNECPRVQSLLTAICSSQTRARALYDTILSIQDSDAFQGEEFKRLTGWLIACGFFRRLVIECKSKDDVARHSMSLVKDCGSGNAQLQRELIAIVNAYKDRLEVGETRVENATAAQPALHERHESQRTTQLSNHGNVLAQVESAIQRIVELYRDGKDPIGDRFRQELVYAQTGANASQEFVVKSLCNIATQCRTAGRPDKASECLELALGFPSGIDSILYIQIAAQLRHARQFDRALHCLDEAVRLDDGSKYQSIQLDRIRIVSDKGDYATAIEAFRSLESLSSSPSALCSLGTLYRRIGKLKEAREEYRLALKIDPRFHVALAGIAESSRQSGRYTRALERYEQLMPLLSAEEEDARKVYNVSRSKICRYLRRFGQARSMLEFAQERSPKDPRINLELSKLWRILGDTGKANHFLNQSTMVPAHQAAAKLYLVAIGEPVERIEQASATVEGREMVEDQSLYAIGSSLQALIDKDYSLVIRQMEDQSPVDRISADFAEVIRFHARTALSPEAVPQRNQRINRIAKRGFPELKHAVAAICTGDFPLALNAERQLAILM